MTGKRLIIRSERGQALMRTLEAELQIPPGAKNVTVTYGVDCPAYEVTVTYYPMDDQEVTTMKSSAKEFLSTEHQS